MIAAFRSEFFLLNRFRTWAIAGSVTVLFNAIATAILVMTAEPAAPSGIPSRPGGGTGIPLDLFVGPGGATAAVTWAIYGFGFLLILTAFTSRIGNGFSSGTFRTALLHHPNRWSLIAGRVGALMLMVATLVAVGLLSGALTSALVAPSQGIDTTGWFGVEALVGTLIDYVQTLGWAFAWALIAAAIAVAVRSVPIGIGIGVAWFGPIENVIGDGQLFASRWFPGLLLQQVVSSSPNATVSTATALTTLTLYGVVAAAVIVVGIRRLDVTT